MIRLRPSGADEVLIKRVRDWYEPGPGVFIEPQSLFSPAMLFTGSTTGAWYDPSDLTTLYRDAAGTLPVTAVEQPVGLMLDKSKGLVLGPELVTNGDFSNGTTGWVTANGGAVVNSRCECTTASNFLSTTAAILTVGKWYSAEFDYFMTAGAKLRVATKDTVGPDVATIVATSQSLVTNAVTRLKIKFQAAVGGFFILQASGATFSGWVDNISIRELPGNHAFNSSGNSANFPVLSARYNLLTKTEQFDDAVWTKSNVTAVNTTETTDPLGGNTADKLTCTSNVTTAHIRQDVLNVTGYTYSFYAKAGTSNFACFTTNTNATYANFNLLTGVVSSSASCTASITLIGNGWYRCTITNAQPGIYFMILGKDADPTIQPYGNGAWTSGNYIYIWGADLRVANDALNQPAYQRVNTATDYDTVGFKPYLRFNGTNQWLQTNSIDFTYGDKMFVSAGVRKFNTTNEGILAELSGTPSGNNGMATVNVAGNSGVSKYEFRSKGTVSAFAGTTSAAYDSPVTNVLSGIGDISGDQTILRINGTQVASSTADQGTGNYGNYPLYIGARAGTSLWFNGRLYQMVVAGKQASAAEITSTETYLNQKTGAY